MVEVRRDIGDVCAYLRADTARPSLGEEPEVIFKRRDPLYVECSQYQFNIAKGDADWKALTPPLPGLHRIGLSPSVPSIRHAGARGGGDFCMHAGVLGPEGCHRWRGEALGLNHPKLGLVFAGCADSISDLSVYRLAFPFLHSLRGIPPQPT